MEGMARLFDGGDQTGQAASEAEIEKLHAKIGQLLVEQDFFGESLRSMSVAWRRSEIEATHQHLSIATQCRLLSISRSSYYYTPVPETDETLALMAQIDTVFMDCPWYGSRQMARHLQRLRHVVGRCRLRRLMAKMGLAPIYQRPRTSEPHPEHRIYPYLLRNLEITRPNHVWCADVTYLPMRRDFLYLVAIREWASRKVLAWRLSNTMDTSFCVEALEDALARFGKPEMLYQRALIRTHVPIGVVRGT